MIFTKFLYLISPVISIYLTVSLAGLVAAHFQYNNVTGYAITDDVSAAAETIDQGERYLSDRLHLIREDEQAMREAATARDMDSEAYSIYLEEVINDRSYEAAEIITDERYDLYDDDDMEDEDIEITKEELIEDPSLILESNDALSAGARVHGISLND